MSEWGLVNTYTLPATQSREPLHSQCNLSKWRLMSAYTPNIPPRKWGSVSAYTHYLFWSASKIQSLSTSNRNDFMSPHHGRSAYTPLTNLGFTAIASQRLEPSALTKFSQCQPASRKATKHNEVTLQDRSHPLTHILLTQFGRALKWIDYHRLYLYNLPWCLTWS